MKKAVCLLLLLFLLPVSAAGAKSSGGTKTIYYFYNNPCASCNPEGEFYDLFNRLVGDVKQRADYRILPCNTFQEGPDAFREQCDRLKIPEKERLEPMLIIGDRWLSGDRQIASGLRAAFCAEFGIDPGPAALEAREPAQSGVSDSAPDSRAAQPQKGKPYLRYYYTSSCGDCEKAGSLLDGIAKRFPEAVVARYNIEQGDNTPELQGLFEKYNVPQDQRQVPVVFFENGYLSGYGAISTGLLQTVETGRADYLGFAEDLNAASSPSVPSLPFIALAGLLNGLNPCAISMLLFFLSVLIAEKKHILSLGFTYIAVKGIVYLAIGFFLYSALSFLESGLWGRIARAVQILAAAVLIVLAALSISDCVASREGKYGKIRLQLPARFRRFNHSAMERLKRPGALKFLFLSVVLVSAAVSAGEFLCTGQVMLATLLYLARTSPASGFSNRISLVVYVAAMLAPLCVLVVAVFRGKKLFDVSEAVRLKLPLVRIANAVLFLVSAAVMIATLF